MHLVQSYRVMRVNIINSSSEQHKTLASLLNEQICLLKQVVISEMEEFDFRNTRG